MKKIFTIIIIAIITCLNTSGCGKINESATDKASFVETPTDAATSQNNKDIISQPSPEVDDTKADNIVNETPKPETPEMVKFTSDEAYLDANRRVKFLGLKEYKKIEGENNTDKPQKGNKYLVLFLSISNTGNEEDYINYNYLSAKVNGKKTDHTFLVNSPRNYPPIFEHIEAGKTIGGFIVWEVPENWKTISLTYNGWKDTDNISLSAKFTKKDLQNPIIYDSTNYN